jgi:N6-L-threonylcarbamoyladenine synthase
LLLSASIYNAIFAKLFHLQQMTTILAIESSCDDTGAAIISNHKIRANVVSSQAIHQAFGGVVPELASRAHQTNIVPVVEYALQQAGIDRKQLDAIAFTQGPGLLGSLLVGVSFAKSLALALDIPIITVDHLHAHLAAHFIDKTPSFPFLCLLVSGGHTLIVRMDSPADMHILGRTTDDAAGEAFDKAGKILNLPYPAGPLIDKYAKEGNPLAYTFPRPDVPGYDYSFSGLKTSFLYFIRDRLKNDPAFVEKHLNDICASYQHRIVDYLLYQLERVARGTGITEIGIAGGVAANSYLRQELQRRAELNGWQTYIPAFEYCTDNAGMVAMAAQFKYDSGQFADQSAAPYARGM